MSDIIIHSVLFTSLFFEVFLLITYIEKRHILKEDKARGDFSPAHYPLVSVIVPCFNEEKTVAKTLDSLLDLDYPKESLEIIVVNDGSTDGTLEALKKYEEMPSIYIYSKENGGKHTALNFGLSKAKGELAGCLDADSFAHEKSLKRIVSRFENPEVMAVTPAIVIHEPKTIIQRIQKIEYTWGVFTRKMLSFMGAIYVTPGPFSIFRTEVFRTLGGYKHAHHTEDFELALRMQSHHHKIENAHDAFVYTVGPKNINTLYTQRLRWSYGFLNNVLDYRSMLFRRKYGDIGLLILPLAILSVFSAIFMFSIITVSMLRNTYSTMERLAITGLPSIRDGFSFDWFFINTSSQALITLAVLFLAIAILYIARRMTDGRFVFSRDILYFLFLYGFLVPFWLGRAVYNTALSKKISWR